VGGKSDVHDAVLEQQRRTRELVQFVEDDHRAVAGVMLAVISTGLPCFGVPERMSMACRLWLISPFKSCLAAT